MIDEMFGFLRKPPAPQERTPRAPGSGARPPHTYELDPSNFSGVYSILGCHGSRVGVARARERDESCDLCGSVSVCDTVCVTTVVSHLLQGVI